jgi:hypothetical protein
MGNSAVNPVLGKPGQFISLLKQVSIEKKACWEASFASSDLWFHTLAAKNAAKMGHPGPAVGDGLL